MTEPTTSHSLHIINLTGMVYGGNAMGRLPDGRAVFVPFGMEGETVQVEIIEEKRGHAIARLVNVIKPSSERITPRCVHFGVCGGCHYQHMPYERQLLVKTGVVREQLTRIGGVDNPRCARWWVHPMNGITVIRCSSRSHQMAGWAITNNRSMKSSRSASVICRRTNQ
jgi:tRNA/tmRNA/rRNA uracil-C5-methylase (TrmA/RlmC/RlmD family)